MQAVDKLRVENWSWKKTKGEVTGLKAYKQGELQAHQLFETLAIDGRYL